MKNQWMKRRSVAALATGAVALAAFSGSQSGLLAGLFEKDRCELPKRVPCGDCSFGYSRTSWRPWGTCSETQAVPIHVPGGGYSPLDGMPYSTIPAEPHDGSRTIIESTPHYVGPSTGEEHPLPILSDPPPGATTSPADPRSGQLLPQEEAPLAPNVRSIEAPVQSRPGDVTSSPAPDALRDDGQQSSQYRGPVEDPIRGLLPGTGYSPLPDGPSSVTDVTRDSLPPSGPSPNLNDSDPTLESPPFTSAPRQSQPETDYSEYIPLPNADSTPKSLPLPNPADRAGNRTGSTLPAESVPDRETPADSAIESFDPGTLPLPESGTRPATPSPEEPGVTQFYSEPDPYPGFRVLPTVGHGRAQFRETQSRVEQRPAAGPVFEEDRVTRTSAHRVNRYVQELTPRQSRSSGSSQSASQNWSADRAGTSGVEYQTPDWKPMGRSATTSQPNASQPVSGWKTMRTVTGSRSTGSSSQRRSGYSSSSSIWQSQSRDSRR